MDIEEWRTVVIDGEVFPNYEVSTEGRVRSLNYKRTGEIKVLKPSKNTYGYYHVELYKNGKGKVHRIHIMVAYTYPDKIPNDNPQEKTQVNHINEDKTDNRVENLEWVTPKENINHGTRTKRMAETKGKCVRCIEDDIIYYSAMEASRQTGLSQGNISACCRGERKTAGGLHWEYVD